MGQDWEQPTQQWPGQRPGTWQRQANDTAQAPWGDPPPPQFQSGPQFPGSYPAGYGQPPQPQTQYQPVQPVQPPRPRGSRRRFMTGLAIAGAFILGIAIGAAASSSGKSTPAAAPTVTVTVTATASPAAKPKAKTKAAKKAGTKTTASAAPATSAAKTKAATGQTVATFSGSGIKNTPKFTVSSDWKLAYTYDCSSIGGSGNFIVDEDGGNDFSGASVDELGKSGSSSTYVYDDAGTHYLSIDSECSWTVKIIGEN